MGLTRKHGPPDGVMRATDYSTDDAASMRERGLAELADAPDVDLYPDGWWTRVWRWRKSVLGR